MNTIDNFSDVSFGGRYLRINENVPKVISDAIYKNQNIEDFVFRKPKQKPLLQRIFDLFRKDEVLDVTYNRGDSEYTLHHVSECGIRSGSGDPYKRTDTVTFSFYREGDNTGSAKKYPVTGEQKGIKRPAGVVPRPGDDTGYLVPEETAEEKIAKEIAAINNIGKLLNIAG